LASVHPYLKDDPEHRDELFEKYYCLLAEIFEHDLKLARLRDNSDLLLRAQGEAFDDDPRLQLVSSIFSNVTTQVTGLTRAIMGVRAHREVTSKDVDLALTGFAKGSLYFGLAAHRPTAKFPLIDEVDTLYDSTRRALSVINEVAHTIEDDDEALSIEEVSEVVGDPKVRDAALLAVQRIAPSGRRGIETLSVSSGSARPAELTPAHRRSIRKSLVHPLIRGEDLQLVGVVREIDLDAKRFDLRGIADEQLTDLRCAYSEVSDVRPRSLLGAMVRVRGLVERSADEAPRLMAVNSLTIVKPPPESLG
jgi:hypothetical protein